MAHAAVGAVKQRGHSGWGISGNKKPIYVNGLIKTMSCKIINKLVWWGKVAITGHCQPLPPLCRHLAG